MRCVNRERTKSSAGGRGLQGSQSAEGQAQARSKARCRESFGRALTSEFSKPYPSHFKFVYQLAVTTRFHSPRTPQESLQNAHFHADTQRHATLSCNTTVFYSTCNTHTLTHTLTLTSTLTLTYTFTQIRASISRRLPMYPRALTRYIQPWEGTAMVS